ncbi:MAG TPA: hypothetical protein VNZ44_20280, partial [Pyrinomonadaceae bacterium]|nr:hypothetical protein [Pyrinomonadaceae bacterium]
KRAFLLLLCLLLALTAVRAQTPQGLNPQASLDADLGRALGFLLGQRITLNRVKSEFPDLASRARQAEAEFNLSFGAAETEMRKALQGMMGDEYPKFLAQAESQLKTSLASQPVTPEIAGNFLTEVEFRAKGKLPSPIFETLLTYQFMGRPAEEFAHGYKRVFRTGGHPKAKGVDFQISYPASWRQSEGERPNIIQRFVSENGRGSEMAMLMVKDLPAPPGHKITQADLDDLFSENELRGMVPAGGRLIAAKPIVLDGQKGGMVVFEQTLQRLDLSMTMRGMYFVTVWAGKMVSVQCMVYMRPGSDTDMQGRFGRFEPVFRLIGNSFVLNDRYK